MELPDDGRAQDELWFSNILCGVLRGALEMVCLCLFRRGLCYTPYLGLESAVYDYMISKCLTFSFFSAGPNAG